jgi:hypothetical protein
MAGYRKSSFPQAVAETLNITDPQNFFFCAASLAVFKPGSTPSLQNTIPHSCLR